MHCFNTCQTRCLSFILKPSNESVILEAVLIGFLLVFTSTSEVDWIVLAKKVLFNFLKSIFFSSLLFFLSSFNYPQYPSQSHTIWEKWIIIVPASPFSSLFTIIHHSFVQTTCITPTDLMNNFLSRDQAGLHFSLHAMCDQ